MDDTHQFTPSELIHLFVDGEATAAQQSLLFSLLAAEADLQEKFRAAVLMHQTLEQVRASAVPPEHYTSELFARAGFAGTAGKRVVFFSALSSAARKAAPLVFSAVVGAAIAFLLLFDRQTGPVVLPAHSSIGSERSVPSAVALPEPVRRQTGSAGIAQQPRRRSLPNTEKRSLISNGISSAPNSESVNISGQGDFLAITTAPVAGQQAKVHRTTALRALVADIPDIRPATATSHITLYLKNIQALGWYPAREIPASDITENISIGALYHFSQEHAAGVEIGREFLPIYYFSDSTQRLERTVIWAGGIYHYQPEALAIAGALAPFARLGLGGTAAGPMARAVLGVRLQTDRLFSAALGVEGSSLLYRRGSTLYTTGKLGVVFQAELQF